MANKPQVTNLWGPTTPIITEQSSLPIKTNANTWNPSVDIQKEQKQNTLIPVSKGQWAPSLPINTENTDVKMQPANTKWNAISGIQPPTPIRVFNGVNKQSRFSIEDTQATDVLNLSSEEYPVISVRGGSKLAATKFASKLLGLFAWKDVTLVAFSGGNLYRFSSASGTMASIATGLSTSQYWSGANFKGNYSDYMLILANGFDPVKKYDDHTQTLVNLPNAPVNMNYVTSHDNRLYGAVGEQVYFSALQKAEDWSTVNDAGIIVVETTDGLPITGLVSGYQHLVVFKKHSMHELYGTNPANYKLIEVSGKVGCPNGHTAKMVQDVLYFLGNDNFVYKYTGGVPDASFSLPIQSILETVNKDYMDRATAGTDGTLYYLSIPTGTSTENNMLLIYDPRYNTWNIVEYPSGMSCGPMFIDTDVYAGFADGSVQQLTGTDDNGTAISFSWVSKPFSFATMAAKTNWYRLWILADVPTGATLDVYLTDTDEGDGAWTLVQSIAADSNVQMQQIMLPTQALANANFMRIKLTGTGQVKVYEITRQERVLPMGH